MTELSADQSYAHACGKGDMMTETQQKKSSIFKSLENKSIPQNRGMTETYRKQSSEFEDDVGRFFLQTSRLGILHPKYRNTENARNVMSNEEEAADGIDDGIRLDGAPARRSSSRGTSARKETRSDSAAEYAPSARRLGVKRKVI
jgi:hypothetical protein